MLAVFVPLAAAAIALPAGTAAEQASQPTAAAAGMLDVSGGATDNSGHTCARRDGPLRCWGFGGNGRLGYGNRNTIGDDETPGAVEPVDVGSGRRAEANSAGAFHSCALLDTGSVRCWGFGGDGRLGYGSNAVYGNNKDIGDDETPGLAGPVNLGGNAKAVTAGGGHSCAVLAISGSVRCWGFGGDGRLGYGNRNTIGDDETPSSQGPVQLGGTAKAISAGGQHTCALLDTGSVRCWGFGFNGQLGYGNRNTIGNDPDETPNKFGPVQLGGAAVAISAGDGHTCAVLAGGSVRCWGFGGDGRLGYGETRTIGDDEMPSSQGPVQLGGAAVAISAGGRHTCALLDTGSVRCWGFGGDGRLGYANTNDVGDDEAPGSVGPVNLGGPAVAISAGERHTCALLDDGSIRCWGYAATGRLGYCNANDIGDDEPPGSVGPVNVTGSSGCPSAGGGGQAATPPPAAGPPAAGPAPQTGDSAADRRRERYRRALAAQARRKRALRRCYAGVRRHARREQRNLPGRASSRRRARAQRHIERHRSRGRRACLRSHGRTPGRVTHLRARSLSRTKVVLSFRAPGTDGSRPPAARGYLVKQSRRPIRGRRGFARAQTLCHGRCRFDDRLVGAPIKLTVTALRPRTTYYYSVAARDNVSGRPGRRSPTAKARTRAR